MRGLIVAAALLAAATPASAELTLETVIHKLDDPVRVVAPEGDSRLFVVERGGLIRIFDYDGIPISTFAYHQPASDIVRKGIGGAFPTGPLLAAGSFAGLRGLGSIDPMQANAFALYHQGVSIDHRGDALDSGGPGWRSQCQEEDDGQECAHKLKGLSWSYLTTLTLIPTPSCSRVSASSSLYTKRYRKLLSS